MLCHSFVIVQLEGESFGSSMDYTEMLGIDTLNINQPSPISICQAS